jgi:hypothetical protein
MAGMKQHQFPVQVDSRQRIGCGATVRFGSEADCRATIKPRPVWVLLWRQFYNVGLDILFDTKLSDGPKAFI